MSRTTAPDWPRCLAIARAMKATPARGQHRIPILFVANVGEEGEGNLSGMRYLCRQSSLASKIRGFHRARRTDDRPHHLPGARKPAV